MANSWWCNDLSILLALISLVTSIVWNLCNIYQSRQVKLNATGDISPSDNSKIQITISNIGKVNTRLGKIGIEFDAKGQWLKPKSGGSFESLFIDELSKSDTILGAGETVRIHMDLFRVTKSLEHISLDDYKKEAFIINKVNGWVYLFRNSLRASNDRINEFENELNDSGIKRFPINFSDILISTLREHIQSYCKK